MIENAIRKNLTINIIEKPKELTNTKWTLFKDKSKEKKDSKEEKSKEKKDSINTCIL